MKIVIVGGGFGGISTALNLAKQSLLSETKIVLISDQPHFEYHPALYRVVTGRSPLEVCVPLDTIFARYKNNKNMEIVRDRINKVDLSGKLLTGESGSRYQFDYLVLALGSDTSYFGISGLPEFSLGFKSIGEALKLKAHLHQIFDSAAKNQAEDKVSAGHLVIVGGGASGVELAGELASYTKYLARQHGLDPALITIDIIEAAPRLLPMMPPAVSARVKEKLHELGVNIFLGRALVKEEIESIELKDMSMKTKTVIWTAGVKNNPLLSGIAGLQFDKKGKVLVDNTLRPAGFSNIFVIGDGAATQYAGMAQTAIVDGEYVAQVIPALVKNQKPETYQPRKPLYSIPVGPGWAVTLLGSWPVYGFGGWLLRRLADFNYFLSILTFTQAWAAFRSGKMVSESCPVCNPNGQLES